MSVELIGRDGELAAIRMFFDGPAPAVLLLEGEPGIGKTSLWRAGIAKEDPDAVLIARPTAAEAELSFAALGDLLVDVLEEALPALPDPQRRALEGALLLTEADGGPPDQRTIGAALLNTLRDLASKRPIAVAIDDVQWLDPASRSALLFCTRRLRNEPVRFLLAARTTGHDEQPAELALAMGEERLERRMIGPLSVGAVRSLLQTRLGASFQRPVLRRLYDTSGGNPFLALEIGRELARAHPALRPGEPLPVPSSLRQLLEGRIARLSPQARRVLVAVSAAGKVEEPGFVVVEGADALAGVDEAVAADVLTREGEELRFSHPLLRSTVYELATPREKRLAHRRLAEVVADTEERARHLALATEAPDVAVAAALDEAARGAFARGAVEGAAALAEQALRFTPEAQPDALQRRRLAAAGYLARAGSKARAKQLLDDGRASAATGPEKARIALASVWWGLAETSAVVDMLGQALAEAEGDVRLVAEVHLVLANSLCPQIDIAAAADHASRGLALAERAGDPVTLALGLLNVASVDFYAGKGSDVARIGRALELEAAVPHPYGEIGVARFVQAFQLMATGDLQRARRSLEALNAEGRTRADAGYADFLLGLARVEIRAGNWERAQELVEEAVEIDREVGDVLGETFCHEALVQLAALRGDVAGARTLATEGLRLADLEGRRDTRAGIFAALGTMELSLRNADAARSHLDETARLVAAMGLGDPGIVPFVPDRVEALVAVGELDAAEAAAAELDEQGRRLARGLALAGATRCRGLIGAARGELPRAVQMLEAASAQMVDFGQPFELARTLLALGTVQRRAQQRRAARETLAEAMTSFDRLGARLWSEQTRAELARIGGRAGSPTELTPSERRVAELVAEGKTNKEVAAILVVADRTVESALTQIYRKLDVRSRTELARKLAEAG